MLRYDQTADALYITLREGVAIARTEQLDPGTLVDVDRVGGAVGVEVIRPARSWPLDDLVEQFDVPAGDAEVLRSLWSVGQPYPFAKQELVEVV